MSYHVNYASNNTYNAKKTTAAVTTCNKGTPQPFANTTYSRVTEPAIQQKRNSAHRSVIHIPRRDREDIWEREYHTYEQCPDYTHHVRHQPQPAVAHVERAGLEPDLRVVLEHPPEEDGDDVAAVQPYRTHREHCVRRDRAGGVK